MHDDMVERVAKAMVASRPIPPSCNLGDVDWSFFRELARTAIEAMREPTDAMLHASTMQVPTWDDEASRRKWQAMIDAALQKDASKDYQQKDPE